MKQKLITFVIIPSSSLQYQFRLWNRRNRFFVGNLGSVRYIDLHTSTIAHRSSATERENDQPQSHRRYFGDGINVISSNVLLTKYAKNGRIDNARLLFDKMSDRDVVSWTAMVTGYAQNGRIDDARHMFDRIPERNVVSWNAMVAGYAQNGRMKDAHTLFNRMPERNMVSWTVMIVGYARSGRIEEALKLFNQMPERNVVSWNAMVTGYAQNGRIEVARQLFDKMPERNVVSWTAMIAGYFDNGRTSEASQLFEQMTERSVVSWTAMIAGYTQNGLGKKAMEFFSHMQQAGMKPNPSTFTSVLNACVSLAVPEVGKQILAHIIKIGFESDVFVGNVLITMYAQFGSDDARKMFGKMQQRDVISWNAMMAGYIQYGRVVDAYQMFVEMSSGFETDTYIANRLVNMYSKCGCLVDARKVFDKKARRDVVTWNAIMAGYVQHGYGEEALKLLCKMDGTGMKPNQVTFASVLGACASLAALEEGKQVHARIRKTGFESDVFLESTLVDVYAKCGSLEDARQVFDKMISPNVVSRSSMIAGYARNELWKEAFQLFEQMHQAAIIGNQFTFTSILSACINPEALKPGKQVHAYIIKTGFEIDVSVGNALITMYAKFGSDDAQKMFCKMQQRDVISWNAMMAGYIQHGRVVDAYQMFIAMSERDVVSWTVMVAGYAQNGYIEEALKFFVQMKRAGMKPNRATFASILSACASLAALEQGKQIHANIIKVEYKSDVFVENALITMYSKCGRVDIAYHVFDKMPERDVVSWSAMIAGYAQHGSAKEALLLFDQMQCTGTKPNHITFVGVLTACSHSCLVDEGWHYYHSMICDHHITPGVDHYACIVDLLGRSGLLNEAEDFIKRMPLQPDPVVWKALLGACRVHANTEVGERVAEHLFKLEPQNPAAYVLLSNIYAAVGRWDDVTKVRLMMKRRGVQKKAGSSWIEIKNKVYSFIVGDRSHPQTKKIYALLDKLNGQMREAGYVPDMNFALHDVEEEEKQHFEVRQGLALCLPVIWASHFG